MRGRGGEGWYSISRERKSFFTAQLHLTLPLFPFKFEIRNSKFNLVGNCPAIRAAIRRYLLLKLLLLLLLISIFTIITITTIIIIIITTIDFMGRFQVAQDNILEGKMAKGLTTSSKISLVARVR